jgi:outer membrane biosynthesis protein TonB
MVSLPSLATGSIRAHGSMVSFNLDNIVTEKDTQASAEEEETNPQVSEEPRKEETEKKKKKRTKSKNRAKSNETEDDPRPRIARHTHRIYEGGNQIRTESTRKPKVSSSSSSKRKTSSSKRLQMTGDLQMAR